MPLPVRPSDIGLPQFAGWRPQQEDAIAQILDNRRRFTVLNMPTGAGKSLTYFGAAALAGDRTGFLTSTKNLQKQLMDDMSCAGLVDIRGRDNYDCVLGGEMSCEDGSAAKCPAYQNKSAIGSVCPSRAARKAALASRYFTTNYTFWTLVNKFVPDGLGDITRLVCDEAHGLPDEITGINAVFISHRDSARLRMDFPAQPEDMNQWRMWASNALSVCDQLMAAVKAQAQNGGITALRELAHVRNLQMNLNKLVAMRGWWVSSPEAGKIDGWSLEPVWAAEHAETTAWCGTPKIVLTSATLSRETLAVLGIPEDQYTYIDYPSSFPTWRSPFFYIPTVRVHDKWTQEDARIWLDRIDEIIGGRLDRKGIIHTTSYDRRDLIINYSRYRHLMITHKRGSADALRAMDEFKRAPAPAIFISPAATTGYDFPHDHCRYQILGNVPYPNTQSRIMQARTGRLHPPHSLERIKGEQYQFWYIATQIAQAAGRSMRADTDWCENFMIDTKFKFAYYSHQGLYPIGFRLLVQTRQTVPPALHIAA